MGFNVINSPLDETVTIFDNLKLTCDAVLPSKFQLKTTPSISQGYTCWCVSFASANMQHCDMLTKYGKDIKFSQGFIHKHCKDIDGCKNELGTTLSAVCTVLTTKGSCEEHYYPFVDDQDSRQNKFKPITSEMLNNAKKYKADSYARCSSVGSIKKAIYNANGAIMALNIFTNYDKDKRGIIGLPAYYEKVRGRHAVFAVGWDDNMEAVVEGKKLKGFLIIQDSDALHTSSDGFRFLPYEAFTTYTRNVDRVFAEAWCTYESKLVDIDYHKKANTQLAKLKETTIELQIGSKIISYDGKKVTMDVTPQVINSTTLLPLKAICDALGVSVFWDNTKKTATVKDLNNGTIRIFKLNDCNVYDYSGKVVCVSLAPTAVINGRTMIPVRALAESLNCRVDYENNTKKITITR